MPRRDAVFKEKTQETLMAIERREQKETPYVW